MGQAQGQKRAPKFKASKYEAPKQRRVTKEQISRATYKDVKLLEKFISDRGKIEPRRKTGTCAKHQRALAISIKRARHLALLPFASAHVHKTESSGIRE